ncbi:conserved hypothetical protein [Ricinus communis]|uniref:Uncharacterized protein n=1 Tax=Ricinus communis TaxID=3988 RepID=B9RIS8_RICCO|nr:conserved hypothetical protein [Ricinus communis]
MSSACEVQRQLSKSRPEDSKAEEELHKDIQFSYTRAFLLSLAELDTCKSLPSGFDSSILGELRNASTCSLSWSYVDSAVVSVLKVQGGIYHPHHRIELNNASTGLSQSSGDSVFGRLDDILSQHSPKNPECGLLQRDDALLRDNGCLVGVSPPMVQGSRYNLLNRNIAPYRPPHLCKMSLHSRTGIKDLTAGKECGSSKFPSVEKTRRGKRSKSCGGRNINVLKGSSITFQMSKKKIWTQIFTQRAPEMVRRFLANAINQRKVQYHQLQMVLGIVLPYKLLCSVSNSLPKYWSDPSIAWQHYDVKVYQTEKSMLSSSKFIDQFIEEDKKPAVGIAMSNENHESKVYVESNRNADESESTSSFCHRNGVPQKLMSPASHSATEKVSEQLCGSVASTVCPIDIRSEATERSIVLEVGENHLTRYQCEQPYDVEEQSNTASHSGISQHLLPLLKVGMDAINMTAPPSDLDSSSARTTGGLRCDLTCGISMGNETDNPDKNADNFKSDSFASGRNASEACVLFTKIPNEQESTSSSPKKCGLPKKLVAPTTPYATVRISKQLCSSSTSVMPPGVLMCKTAEQSSALDKGQDATDLAAACSKLSSCNTVTTGNLEVIENHFSQCQCVEPNDIENEQPRTASHSGSSQHLLDLLKMGKIATELAATVSKLKSPSASNTENSGHNLICEPMDEAGFPEELQIHPSAGLAEYDFFWHIEFPSSFDSKIIPSPVDVRSRVDNETATSLSHGKRTNLNKSKDSGLVSSEVDNKIVLDSPGEQELELIPAGGFDEKAHLIGLPDEDSLIILDDLIFQMDSILVSDGNSTDTDLAASRTPASNAQKSAAVNISLGDDRCPSSLKNATLASTSVAKPSNSYSNMSARQPFSLSHENPRKPLFHHSEVRSSASEIFSCGPVHHSVMHPFPKQMIFPGSFPHQLNGLGSGAHSNQMVYYSLWPSQNITQNYEEQIYGMPNPAHNKPIGGNCNQAVYLSGTEKAEQIHPGWP